MANNITLVLVAEDEGVNLSSCIPFEDAALAVREAIEFEKAHFFCRFYEIAVIDTEREHLEFYSQKIKGVSYRPVN